MRIAIVDDIASERNMLKTDLDAQLARLSLDATISSFCCGTDFLCAAEKERFDLVFLDIYMRKENGIDTAERLRCFDPDCLLVFTTTSRDHALEGFRVRALHYLVKPYQKTDLTALFDEIVKRFSITDKYIEINTTGGVHRLRFQDILYAEHYKHQIYIYGADGKKYVTRRTFREFTDTLTDGRFFLCSRGVLVNMEHAEDLDGMDFILKGGKKVPVSRSLAKAAHTAFGDYLFKDFKYSERRH